MKPLIVAPITTGGKLYMGRVHVAAHFENGYAEGALKINAPVEE